MAYWESHRNSNLTEEDYEDFDKALDVLAVTHTMLTFEYASNSMSSHDAKSKSKASDRVSRKQPIKPPNH